MNRLLPALVLVLWAAPAAASELAYLEVSPTDRADLNQLLQTVEEDHDGGMPSTQPIVVILHGEEAASFIRSGYAKNRSLVDRAAKLDAYRLIDVRMCETWMTENGVRREDVPAFIETVPYAPEEIEKLEAAGYEPYDTVNI